MGPNISEDVRVNDLSTSTRFPKLCDLLPDLDRLISEISHDYHVADLSSHAQLVYKVNAFFSSHMIDRVEAIVPGWRAMIEGDGGTTLVHILTALVALPLHLSYLNATPAHQCVLTWAVLFHDIAKRSLAKHSDHTHGFRSAARFVQSLPRMGIKLSGGRSNALIDWSNLVESAVTQQPGHRTLVQDNRKLPQILEGIEKLTNNPSAILIAKIVLLHHSITSLDEWPQANPLNEVEIKEYVSPELLSLLEIMALVDNDGWELFEPDNRERYRDMTRRTFAQLQSEMGS